MMTNRPDEHRCNICGAKHRSPKGHRALVALLWCAILAPIQVLAGLALDGWLAWALFAIAARNVILAVLLIVGLSQLAEETAEQATR
jgi:4-amino-4-deoxy-L-arabinose transferase-like glycosyltransferase